MSEQILASLVHLVVATISVTGYAGVALLMAVESACIPLPSEVILPFAGYLVATTRFGGGNSLVGLLLVATAGAIGCNLGSFIAYWIGAVGGRPLVVRYGRFIFLSHHDLDRMTAYFQNWGSITVLLGRMLPVVRTFIAFPAGIARMSQVRFHLYTFLGSWPWCFALAYVGKQLGDRWNSDPAFQEAFHRFHLVVELAMLAALFWFVWTHWRRAKSAPANGRI